MSTPPTFLPPQPLDDNALFGAPPVVTQAPPDGSIQPTQDANGEWFLDAGDGTRYKDVAAAAAGTRERNAYIARLESQLNAGRQAFGVGPQPQAATPAEPDYINLIEQSISAKNPSLIRSAIHQDAERIATRKFEELLAPYQSLMAQAALQSATEIASSGPKGDPNISTFVRGGALDRFKVEHPELGEIITLAQQQPQLSNRLPGLLRDAYRIASAGAPAAPAVPGQRLPSASSNPATPVANATSDQRRAWLLDQPLESLLGQP